jgi:hypothetical protein
MRFAVFLILIVSYCSISNSLKMAASISVNLLSNFRKSTSINRVVTIASSPDSAVASLRRFFPSCDVAEPEWFGKFVADVKPLKETANEVEFMLPSAQESQPFVKFVVSILPTACSRHNSKSNAHALGGIVRANKGKGDAVVLLAPASLDVVFAQACAGTATYPCHTRMRTPPKPVCLIPVCLMPTCLHASLITYHCHTVYCLSLTTYHCLPITYHCTAYHLPPITSGTQLPPVQHESHPSPCPCRKRRHRSGH